METIEIQKCVSCKSSLIDDLQRGERICSNCGIVVVEQMEDYGPERIGISSDTGMKLARATGQTTLAQHDLGISTEISIGTTDFSGKKISAEVQRQMNNGRTWHKRVRVSSSRDRRLTNVLGVMSEICQNCSLPKNVLETASKIYRSLDGKDIKVKGKSVVSISAAVVYMACKRCDVIRTLDEILHNICSTKEIKSRTRLASRYYRTLVMELGTVSVPDVTMDKYISKIANMTTVSYTHLTLPTIYSV